MKPRANALGLVLKGDCILLEEQCGTHSEGQGVFYRPIGGTIEWGEHSSEALAREFQEELDAEIEIDRYIGCLENIYAINETVSHEITQMYFVRFKDPALYVLDELTVTEGEKITKAKWIPLSALKSNNLVLYPVGCLDLIRHL